ncbi:hypothetical protein DOTSEDRAFT_54274 [Dothistroma septosporum NZE10]|uniref:Chromo domain-containing protein n=1 Tax=Dothistroma septosporum (strain NZE10 / CBS 128990) TaxID=675120 RepID=M2XM03_DOTSN|nr:hypothetical protein DOTSEDRAFT_54274 [Dothistroma septosporum NZE10]
MPKRKRGIAQSTSAPTKRTKRAPTADAPGPSASPHPHGAVDFQKEYKLRAIIDETKTKYLIDWEDDSETGEKYEPTWELKANANKLAKEDWNARKSPRAQKARSATPQTKKRGRPPKQVAESSSVPSKKPVRPKRVIDSPPDPPDGTAKSGDDVVRPPSESGPAGTEPELEIDESEPEDDDESLPSVPADLPHPDGRHVAVQVSDPPSSYQAGAYERIAEHGDSSRSTSRGDSSLKLSASLSITTEVYPSTANESVLSQAPPQSIQTTDKRSISLVVPDSQSQQQIHETSSFKGFSPAPEPELTVATLDPASSNVRLTLDESPPKPLVEGPGGSDKGPEATSHKDLEPAQPDITSQGLSIQPYQSAAKETTASDKTSATEALEQAREASESRAPALSELPVAQGTAASSIEYEPAAVQARASLPSQQPVLQPEHSGDNTASAKSSTNEQPSQQADEAQVEGGVNEGSVTAPVQRGHRSISQAPGASSSDGAHSPEHQDAVQTRPVAPATSESSSECIVISSETEQGQNPSTELPDNSAQFLSQAQHSPPPGAQRPPPSSILNGSVEDKLEPPQTPQRATTGLQNSAPSLQATVTQSSVSFQTQLDPPTSAARKVESPIPASTSKSGRGAVYVRPLQDTALRPPSVISDRPFDSPLPSIPSQTLPGVGESAPPRFQTPTPSQDSAASQTKLEMDPSASKGPSLSSQLKALREGRRQKRSQTPAIPNNAQPVSALPPSMNAEVAAARLVSPGISIVDGVRSPSAVPAVEPEPLVTREEMNTSERYETLIPQAQSNGLDYQGNSQSQPLMSSNIVVAPVDPNEDPEVANMHIVPIPFNGPQRDSYQINVTHQNDFIERFLAERHPADQLLEEAESLLQGLHNLATHPDLTNPETLSQTSEPDRQAQWDSDSSGKFCFLQELFDALQALNQNTRVAVAARGGRILDMLETFCSGWYYSYSRSGVEHPTSQPGKEKLHVTILDLDHDNEMPKDADIVIALDGTTEYRHRVIRAARLHTKGEGMTGTNSWAMLLTLVAPRTVEHIERCLAPNLPRLVRARVLVGTARKLQWEACRKEHDGQDYAKDAAKKLVEYLDDPEATGWPLGALSQIQDLDSQTETELEFSHADLFDTAEGDHPAKRARLLIDPAQLPTTMSPQDMEITHVSDSLGKTTQPSLDEIFAARSGPSLREQQLEAELDRVQARLEDHIEDLERVQYQNESQRREIAEKSSEREEAVSRVQAALTRMTMAENNTSTLKSERTELQKQLSEANAKLLDHLVPERAEFENLRLEAEAARAAKVKADKSAEKAQNEMEWFRSMYQDSSNKARELQAENNDLQVRLAVAEQQASGEIARARQVSKDNHHKNLERENHKLRAIVMDREAGLKFRDEEITRLKESTRGRMGTRQSSVPRSPRLGSPMKLAGERASRQASPAAGELRGKGGHPLRNSAGG